jgi:predicted Rossmann fold nucleotide-binding protein DprA/Smf involved in DNA uptake
MDNALRDPREVIRDEMFMQHRVLETLRDGPKTVPQIADALGSPVHEVMYWVMASRKYGLVEEIKEPEDDYYQYALVEKK